MRDEVSSLQDQLIQLRWQLTYAVKASEEKISEALEIKSDSLNKLFEEKQLQIESALKRD